MNLIVCDFPGYLTFCVLPDISLYVYFSDVSLSVSFPETHGVCFSRASHWLCLIRTFHCLCLFRTSHCVSTPDISLVVSCFGFSNDSELNDHMKLLFPSLIPLVWMTTGAKKMIEQSLFSTLPCFQPFEELHSNLSISLCNLSISFFLPFPLPPGTVPCRVILQILLIFLTGSLNCTIMASAR